MTDEARWRAVVDAVLAEVRPSRHPGQQRRHRRPRQHRDGDARRLAQGQRGQCRGHVSRLPRGGAGDEGERRRLDRQSLLGRRHHRRRVVGRLLREQGRGAPSDQIGRAPLRALGLQDSRQFRSSLVRRDADGARGHRASEGPRAGARRPRPRRADGPHGQGGRGREHDPLPRQRRILVHHRRRSSWSTGD